MSRSRGSSPFVSASSSSSISEFSQPILSNESGLGEDGLLSVEVDCKVAMFEGNGELSSSLNLALANNNSSSISKMARSKQTMRKSGQDYNKYWHATFGKPGGKASKHLRARQEDDDDESSSSSSNSDTSETNVVAAGGGSSGNAVVQNALQVGRRRRQVVGGKVQVYKRAPTKNQGILSKRIRSDLFESCEC